jgi:uncharacterized protein (TIGR02145 family)
MLKKLLTFSALTISLNVTSVNNSNQFNKEAYLNLNQEYNFNNYVATEKKKGIFDSLFTGTFSSIRNELGSTDSDNMGQLGSKISNNLKNKVINNSISQVEQFINKTANEFVNNTSNRSNNANDSYNLYNSHMAGSVESKAQNPIDTANNNLANKIDAVNSADTTNNANAVNSVDTTNNIDATNTNLNNSVDTTDKANNTDSISKINNSDNDSIGGKTNISITISNNPTFSIKTILPVTTLTNNSTALTFVQAQLNSSDSDDELRNDFNIGIGQRFLFGDKQSIIGINLFNDYEVESEHHRISLGLEYQRANFTANFNKYFAISDKMNINDEYSEEALSGLDIRLTGKVPFLPWAKIKASHYIWDKTEHEGSEDITGTILGVEVQLNPALSIEVGAESSNSSSDDNNVESYVTLNAQLPFKGIATLNNLGLSKQAFANANTLKLTDLNLVERSSKIRIEKVLNNTSAIAGVYNAATAGAQCTLYNSSGVAIKNGSGQTTATGSLTLYSLSIPEGLVSMKCVGGGYIDEATGRVINPAPTLHAATIYSGADDLTLIVSPLSEIAYMLAGGNDNNSNLADNINDKNILIAQAFGIKDVDIIATIPTDINLEVVQDDNAGKFGLILAAVSQMSENVEYDSTISANGTGIIEALYLDILNNGIINGVESSENGKFVEVVDIATAINNFKHGTGANNNTDGTGANNTGSAESSIGEGSIMGDLAITKIDAYDGESDAPTLVDYINADVNGVVTINLLAVNDHMIGYDVSTTAKIQTRVNVGIKAIDTAIAKIANYDNASSLDDTPTLQDYIDANVSKVNATNLDHINTEMASMSTIDTNTTIKIQNIVNAIIKSDFTIDSIANVSIVENSVFVGVAPTTSGDKPIGLLTYTLDGDDADLVTIDILTGVVTMVGHNFEDPEDSNKDNIYEIIIVLTDVEGNTASEQQTITVANATESADFRINAINNVSIVENNSFKGSTPIIIGNFIESITYSLSGADVALFTLDIESGVISMIAKDFENPIDANKDNTYEVVIVATDLDGNTDSEEQIITITDIDDDHIALNAIDNASVEENKEFIGIAPTLINTYTSIGFETYSLDGVDAADFTIDSLTGVINMFGRNFEEPGDDNKDNIYEIVIVVTDAENNTASQSQTITVTNVIETAEFSINPIENATVAENATFTGSTPSLAGDVIGDFVYTVGGADANVFTINSTTGVVTMVGKNFENPIDTNADNIYEIIIIATDVDGNTDDEEQTITVEDAIETLNFSINTIDDISIPENSAFTGSTPSISGDTPIGVIAYSLGNNDADMFTIDPITGIIAMVAKDFENSTDVNTDNNYKVSITATDEDGNTAVEYQTITITNVNESIVTIEDKEFSVDENAPNTTMIGMMQSTGNHTGFSIISGNTNTAFKINNSGQITVNNSSELDFETTTKYTLGVQVSGVDADVQTANIVVNTRDLIEVSNFAIEPMVDFIIPADVSFRGVAPSLIGDDKPIGNVVFTLGGVDSRHFTIDPIIGVITMTAQDFYNPEDVNNDNVYEIIITATDDDNNTASTSQKVEVTLASVSIGSQTWSAHNLRLDPAENYIIDEDYSDHYVGDSGSTSDDDGYYYNWDVAQSICPNGWRLPSDDDWKTLEGNLGMNYDEIDEFGWRGDGASTQLKEGGSIGFNAKMSGFADNPKYYSFNFYGRGGITYFWTSTVSNADTDTDEDNAYRRSMSTIETKIYRDILLKTFMLSVRCVK